MKACRKKINSGRLARVGMVALLVIVSGLLCRDSSAQTGSQLRGISSSSTVEPGSKLQPSSSKSNDEATPSTRGVRDVEPAGKPQPPQFRVEHLPIKGGADLFTIFGRLDGLRSSDQSAPEVPLITLARDTLGDDNPENDRLRYVWMLTYTRPTVLKRLFSAVPFLYLHVGNQTRTPRTPAPLLDLTDPKRRTWNNFFWFGLQSLVFDSYGIPLKAATRSYRQNANEYRSAHVSEALLILRNYETLRQRAVRETELLARRQPEPETTNDRAVTDINPSLLPEAEPTISEPDILELRARLILSEKAFGGLYPPDMFRDIVSKRLIESNDIIGHNWEMLRQRAETEGLYFQPLSMPDGSPTHALLWIAKSDLLKGRERTYYGRFLSIANPWTDNRLRNWSGYTEVRWFDQDGRPSSASNPRAHAVEMIPLALYGLDHPKIPAVLIDFRDELNPKRREVSRRVFRDLARNIFSLSSFGNLPYFVGRRTYDFITGRRGVDLNQPTRLQSYSELKLLLSFNGLIDQGLKHEIERRLEHVSVNPLNNDTQTEVQIAWRQYNALLDFARRPNGLEARIERDRRAEMMPLKHGPWSRLFFTLGNVLSFGRYVHRETLTPDMMAQLDSRRVIEYHTKFLTEVAKSSPQIEVAWDMHQVRRSLQILADRGERAGNSTLRAISQIFQRTSDDQARLLSLQALSRINSKAARMELVRLYHIPGVQPEWRVAIADRLRKAVTEDSRIKPAEVKAVLGQLGP